MPDHHAPIRKDAFVTYLRGRFSPAGYDVSEVADAPYKELVKHQPEGFAFGLSIGRDGSVNPGDKARVGVWFRPAGKGGIAELSALRNHYQVKLQQQGRGCRIHSCAPPVGTFFLFWETTAPLPEGAVSAWVEMVEELSGLCFDTDALDAFLTETT
ncbi:MAG TPA: hypothetical protein PKI03_01805 [Pseudomonadota bacterium]|nr:hypothetical protein [Pseudomonadota bacterium]